MRTFLLAALFLTFAGCATTKVASLTDPDYRNISFKRVLVIADIANIDLMKRFETNIVEEFVANGIYAVENYKVLPPIREYTDDEKRAVFLKERFDCYFIIAGKGVNMTTMRVPSISSTSINVEAQTDRGKATSTTIASPGGEVQAVTSIDSQGELHDFQNSRMVWRGEGHSDIPYFGGAPAATPDQVFKSNCEEFVVQLIKDGVVAKSK